MVWCADFFHRNGERFFIYFLLRLEQRESPVKRRKVYVFYVNFDRLFILNQENNRFNTIILANLLSIDKSKENVKCEQKGYL